MPRMIRHNTISCMSQDALDSFTKENVRLRADIEFLQRQLDFCTQAQAAAEALKPSDCPPQASPSPTPQVRWGSACYRIACLWIFMSKIMVSLSWRHKRWSQRILPSVCVRACIHRYVFTYLVKSQCHAFLSITLSGAVERDWLLQE